MIVSDNDRWEYNGDGVSTAFGYDNTIFAPANVQVYVDGVGPLVLNTDYTVTGAPNYTAGNVVFAAAPAAGVGNVVIQRDVPNDQQTPFPVGTAFPSAAVEKAFDRACVEIQQLATKVARSLRLGPAIAGAFSFLLNAIEPGKFLRINATGDGVELAEVQLAGNVVTASTAQQGIVELATDAEGIAGADAQRAMTPHGDKAALTAALAPVNATLATLTAAVHLPTGFIAGLGLSNNGLDANNDIDIAAGSARDSLDGVDMVLAANMTKRLDAAWAVGTNQGGLFTGAKANSTWYHVFIIKRTDTGVVDVGFDTAPAADHIPAPYTKYRRIGAVLTDGAGKIRAFTARGAPTGRREFYWNTPQIDLDAANPGTAAVSRTLSTPFGVRTEALVALGMYCNSTSTQPVGYLSDLARADVAPLAILATSVSGAGGQVVAMNDSSNAWNWGSVRVWTDLSAQIRSRVTVSDAVTRIGIVTHGWAEAL